MISSCGLQPGEELRGGELAERYRVLKSPVREALHRLSAEGLIETEPRLGRRVARISIADVKDILDMRETLEAAAAMKTTREATDTDLALLDVYREADVGCAEIRGIQPPVPRGPRGGVWQPASSRCHGAPARRL